MEDFTCTRCGGTFSYEGMTTIDNDQLCEDCTETHTTTCDRCGERIWQDETEGDSNYTLCHSCYENHYTACDGCSRLVAHNDAYTMDDDDDCNYCYECYQRRQHKCAIHEYNYKPEPVFYGEGDRYFGVELEIDDGGKDSANARALLAIANQNEPHIYIKSDGSLDDGMEIVTHPMSLVYHKEQMPWQQLTRKALALDYYSHKAETCGLHIHINRTTFGKTRDLQDICISRVLFIVERFWEELLLFSRRTQYQLDRWAARYGYKHNPKEILEHAKSCSAGRYTCVNLTNYDTIEFRIFRGTLRTSTILATIQLVDAICSFAVATDDVTLSQLSWPVFLAGLDGSKVPELIQYLKERRLYLNEPVEIEEED